MFWLGVVVNDEPTAGIVIPEPTRVVASEFVVAVWFMLYVVDWVWFPPQANTGAVPVKVAENAIQ